MKTKQYLVNVCGYILGAVTGAYGYKVYDHGSVRQPETEQEPGDKEKAQRCQEILKYGAPQQFPDTTCYTNHVLFYDQAKKIPLWVAEYLTKENLKGDANRRHSRFKPDPDVPIMFSAQNKDYWNSGYSRGHMAPAGDNKRNQEAMNETFYLSNILPQELSNNAGFWNRMEIYCRDLTKKYKNVHIISGPLMIPSLMDEGRLFMKYQVLGENQVAVPTHLYKIIVIDDPDIPSTSLGAFVVPNERIPKEKTLTDYQVPVEDVERLSGFHFLPKLDRSVTSDLCKVDSCELMSVETLELYMTSRKLESANTLHRLEKVWTEAKEKGLAGDETLINTYRRRKAELEEKDLTRADAKG